jgi:hypothetical protein
MRETDWQTKLEVFPHLLFKPTFTEVRQALSLSKDIYNQSSEFQITRVKETVWLTFRGSSTINDWMSNIKEFFFLKQVMYASVEGALNQILDEYKNQEKTRIIITGHSRGAALAVFSTYYLKKSFHNVNCISFACPQMDLSFDPTFGATLQKYSISFAVRHDPIPAVNFSKLQSYIPFFQGRAWVGKSEEVPNTITIGEENEILTQMLSSDSQYTLSEIVAFHSIENYEKTVRKYPKFNFLTTVLTGLLIRCIVMVISTIAPETKMKNENSSDLIRAKRDLACPGTEQKSSLQQRSREAPTSCPEGKF